MVLPQLKIRQDSSVEIKLTQFYALGNKATLRRYECGVIKETLGYYISPAGNMSYPDPIVQTEFPTKLKVSQKWAISILKINLNKKEPHMAYHAILKVKSGYSVGTTPLNKKDLGKIDTEATQSIHTQNMAHGLTMTPLTRILQWEEPGIIWAWYIYDSALFTPPSPAAVANEMRLLLEYGPTCGYFPYLEKSILIDAPPADLEGVTPRSNQRSRRG